MATKRAATQDIKETSVTPTYLCFFCALPLIEKTVFGKTVYECPKCKRRVKPEDLIADPAIPAKA